MDPETIQKTAAELAKHLPGDLLARYWWLVLLVQAVLTVGAVGFAAFYSGYLRTWGQNLATRDDFDLLTAQLKANTQLVETVKAEVGQRDWAKREWANVRRTKLETLFEKVHDCSFYLEQLKSRAIEGKIHEGRGPIAETDTIIALYFPELNYEHSQFRAAYLSQEASAVVLQTFMRLKTDDTERKIAIDNFSQQYSRSYPALLKAITELETVGRKRLTEIMGVAE
jgi:hypothetical protein